MHSLPFAGAGSRKAVYYPAKKAKRGARRWRLANVAKLFLGTKKGSINLPFFFYFYAEERE
jgi:hypothetical protein